ncbi:MAG: CBS domain-containing protein [Nitrospirae bacterium]|nr:CBS domain-containing protein [Nitrospirota bacterium]
MLNNKKVKDLMVSISDYPHMKQDDSVKDAFFILRKNFKEGRGYRSILVLNEENQLRGLLSMRDLIRAVEPRFLKMSQPPSYQGPTQEYPALTLIWQELFSKECKEEARKPVKDIMTPVKPAVTPDDPIAKVVYLMVETNSRVIPVIDNDKVVGVVRLVDVFNEIASVVLED